MVNDNPTLEPLPPATGVHVYVTVQTPAPPAAAPPKLRSSFWGYAAFGFIIVCAVIGYVAAQLLASGVISIGP
jgi:hypothetical protein